MSTNVIFLENDYIIDRKPNNKFDLNELSDTLRQSLEGSFKPMKVVLETTTSPLLDTQQPRRSGRIVRALDRFMFLGEAVSDEYDLDPNSYNEAISDKDSEN